MAIPRLRAATRLFAVYAALSAIPVVALGVVLDTTYRHQALANGLSRGQEQAAVIGEMAITPALGNADLTDGLTRGKRSRLSAATDLAVYKGSVLRLRLQDFSGQVVFADNGRTDGALDPQSRQFTEALYGRTTAEVVPLEDGQAVRVVRPVAGASGRSTGVLEIHLPYDSILAAVDAQVRIAWTRLMIGLVLLYAVLAAISWSTTRSLRRHAAQSEHEATHDSLTGLPNRGLFESRATTAFAGATADDPVAVVLIDLDRFKEVNDSLGHHAGDELLRKVAQRLKATARVNDTVARLGGDEFGLVLTGIRDEQTAVQLVEVVRRRLGAELELEGVVLNVEASMGVALYPQHGTDIETVLRRADSAMYRGKRGTRSVMVAQPGAGQPQLPLLALHAELRKALETDELILYYQPKVALATGRTIGVEALVRWQHPEHGVLGPGGFLPGVERSDLIGPFTTWVLRQALRDLVAWTAAGLPWTVAVNVSARNLETPGFVAEVLSLLREHAVEPAQIVLEITETALAGDASAVSEAVHALAARGVAVSIDDFGTGWSSLSQLRSLPVAEVKIDRAFVARLDTDLQDRAVVQSVVDLAHGLGCHVTAEGVESQETADWLRASGCDQAQGYLWGRPAPWQSLGPTVAGVLSRAGVATGPVVPSPSLPAVVSTGAGSQRSSAPVGGTGGA